MLLPIYQIDAFAKQAFEGNPAAVVSLDEWLSDEVMQAIAQENNLAETAFFVPVSNGFHIRWFTPTTEVKLCGHATLAAAFVLFNHLGLKGDTVQFDSLSGPLSVTRNGPLLTLNFPLQEPQKCDIPEDIVKGLGKRPTECLKHEDFILVFDRQDDIAKIIPNHDYLKRVDLRGVIVTAPAEEYDFVARFFAPKVGIPEDPVTGSAYTQLAPYWSARLHKTRLSAKQISARGGELSCELNGDSVLISGTAIKYLEGSIDIKI